MPTLKPFIAFMLGLTIGLGWGVARGDTIRPFSGSIIQRPMGSDATPTLPYCDYRYATVGEKCVVRK